jgi:outer membrane murein-binding lipoprotein Lpp
VYANIALKSATRADLWKSKAMGLEGALVREKQRRKRGKHMGIVAPDQPGHDRSFSPAKIETVWTKKEDLEAQKKQAEKDRRAAEAEEQRKTRAAERAENRLRNRRNWKLVAPRKRQISSLKLKNSRISLRNRRVRSLRSVNYLMLG